MIKEPSQLNGDGFLWLCDLFPAGIGQSGEKKTMAFPLLSNKEPDLYCTYARVCAERKREGFQNGKRSHKYCSLELRAADGPCYMLGQMACSLVSVNTLDCPGGKWWSRKLGWVIGWGVRTVGLGVVEVGAEQQMKGLIQNWGKQRSNTKYLICRNAKTLLSVNVTFRISAFESI